MSAIRARVWPPLAGVFVVAVAVRLLAALSYPTAALWGDSLRFARVAPWAPETGMFDDPWMPAGYPLFLRGIQQVSRELWVTVALQHVIGLCSGLLLFALLRRLHASRALALVAAAALVLSGDFVYMEHALLSEWLTVFLVIAGLYLVVRAEGSARPLLWLGAGGLVLALAALVRNVALVVLAVTVLWIVLRRPPGVALRRRGVAAGTVLATAVVALGAYAGLATSQGRYSGISELSGWFAYGRTAPFADCGEFDPAGREALLCERTPPSRRAGPFHYINDTTGPGRLHFDLLPWACRLNEPGRRCDGPEQDALRAFARKAILHQPAAYAKAVTKDLVRYADPRVGADRPWWGSGPDENSFRYRDPTTQRMLADALGGRYTGVSVESSAGRGVLESYQALVRLNGTLLLAVLLVAIAGVALGRGPARPGAVLLLAAAAALYVVPVASFSFDYRYGMPPQPLLVGAAALGATALLARRAARAGSGERSDPETEPRTQTTAPRTAVRSQA
jgi:4-amino-4-deoxy-L-arabinose transferase-like glycosyltransferase